MGDLPLRTPTYHRLGGPLPRQLANRTHGQPAPPKISPRRDAPPRQYGGLIRVSTGYTPVPGRFHTRYSPVRRSPARYCYLPLPLDLHVLSLSLAFILSQDQTLHGIQIFYNPIAVFLFSLPDQSPASMYRIPLAASSNLPISLKNSFFFIRTPPGRKRMQR